MKELINEQQHTPIVPVRKINPAQLKKKVDQLPKLDELSKSAETEFKEENGLSLSKKSSILDGAVSITGQPTIRSIKNLRNQDELTMRVKRKPAKKSTKPVEKVLKSTPKEIKRIQRVIKPVSTIVEPYASKTFSPIPRGYKYKPVSTLKLAPVVTKQPHSEKYFVSFWRF